MSIPQILFLVLLVVSFCSAQFLPGTRLFFDVVVLLTLIFLVVGLL